MIDRSSTHQSKTEHRESKDATPLKILLVDDMRTMRAYTRTLLVSENYLIQEATNGAEAIAIVEHFRPHLVLMDISMPEMDGITCCRKLKKQKGFSDIKIIMVTGKNEYKLIAEAFRAGCDDYVTKPISRNELLEKINDITKMVRARQKLRTCLNEA